MDLYCVTCGEDNPDVEIVLAEGHILYAHEDCIFTAIIENASKDNPVHSIDKIED